MSANDSNASPIRLACGSGPYQFGELGLPAGRGPFPVVVNIHGGFWSAQYDLSLGNPTDRALQAKGIATWNLEYRRVGNPGGGWPGTFQDVRDGFQFLSQIASKYKIDLGKLVVMGHSSGGQLALCLAGHDPSISRVVSLAGVVDLPAAWTLKLGGGAVAEFLGGSPVQVPEHYREADPMQLSIKATQWLIHGASDDIVPSSLSRSYTQQKKARGEDVHYLEIGAANHFDMIDPRSAAWPKIESTLLHLLS